MWFIGKGYAKEGIAKQRKLCLSTNNIEVPESSAKQEIRIAVVPVEVDAGAQAPPPPKLERQTNKAYSREEALREPADEPDTREEDDDDKVVNKPVAPQTFKPLARVDKLRMMARNGLP